MVEVCMKGAGNQRNIGVRVVSDVDLIHHSGHNVNNNNMPVPGS